MDCSNHCTQHNAYVGPTFITLDAVLTCWFFAILTFICRRSLSPIRHVAVLFVADPTCRRFDWIPVPIDTFGIIF